MIGHNTAAHGEAVLLLLLHEAGVPRALLIWACRAWGGSAVRAANTLSLHREFLVLQCYKES